MDISTILLATVFLVLGLSFSYKFVEAVFFGRTYYWAGFLPIGIISPFFIHWPPGKNSLIKRTQKWWIHLLLGPPYFFLALIFLSVGADKLGFDGAGLVNSVLTLGNADRPPAITYSKENGYRFPVVARLQKTLWELFSKQVEMKPEDALPGQENQASTSGSKSQSGQQQPAQQQPAH